MGLLEHLRDGNFLKPVVWAEYCNDPEKHCGFSLGVRRFVRPLYLYTKLRDLREHGDNGIALEDVKAYQCVERRLFKKKPSLAKKRSKYKIEKRDKRREVRRDVKPPCESCKIFFGDSGNVRRNRRIRVPFGNCGEFDVIKTRKLNDLLSNEETPWESFKLMCDQHLRAFNSTNFTNNTTKPSSYDIMEAYYTSTRAVKCLNYEWDDKSYKLKANWPLN